MLAVSQRGASFLFPSFRNPALRQLVKSPSYLWGALPLLASRHASRLVTAEEGSVRIEFPADKSVLFNPHDCLVRDLKVLVAETFARKYSRRERWEKWRWFLHPLPPKAEPNIEVDQPKDRDSMYVFGLDTPLRLLDCCTATGVSGLRLTKELTRSVQTFLCDSKRSAAECAQFNATRNLSGNVHVENNDCRNVLFMHRDPDVRFDIIDVDPSSHPLHIAALAMDALSLGGLALLHVRRGMPLPTWCTDLCIEGESDFRQQENQMRVVLGCLQTLALPNGRVIDPLLAVNIQGDFFVALTVNVFNMDEHHLHNDYQAILFCATCRTKLFQPFSEPDVSDYVRNLPKGAKRKRVRDPATAPCTCPVCSSQLYIAGEAWCRGLTNKEFLSEMSAVLEQQGGISKWFSDCQFLHNLLAVLQKELDGDFCINLKDMASRTGCPEIPATVFISALKSAGFDASATHLSIDGIRTNAWPALVWEIFHFWMKKNGKTLENTPQHLGRLVLEQDPHLNVEFPLGRDETLHKQIKCITEEAYSLPSTNKQHGLL